MPGIRAPHAAPGQAVVLVAIILPLLVALLFTAVEAGSRMLQRQQVEDALRQASRSALQTFQYAMFAQNTQGLRSPAEVETLAKQLFRTNLQGVGGLAQSPAATADLAQWTILATGGTCGGASFTTPAICARVDVPMRPLVPFWQSWTPHIEAVEVIDRIDTSLAPNP